MHSIQKIVGKFYIVCYNYNNLIVDALYIIGKRDQYGGHKG